MKKTLRQYLALPIIIMALAVICLVPKKSQAQFTKLYDFAGATSSGSLQQSSLISVGADLYGMAPNGGTYNLGVLFKISTTGTYTTLVNFAGTSNGNDGADPLGSLVYDGTYLYGMTTIGGTNDNGTIFKVKPDGSSYLKIFDFVGTSKGRYPIGSLIFDSSFTYLYGMTEQGGANDMGSIFKITPSGTYTKLYDFLSTGNDGNYPFGDLIFDSSYTHLYGMTGYGGTNDWGTIFKIDSSGGASYHKFYNFGSTGAGKVPVGSLIFDGTCFYGMTAYGGTSNWGTVFKISLTGTGYFNLLNFDGTNGIGGAENLIFDRVFLYGVAPDGGAHSLGTMFKIKPDSTDYAKLYDFDSVNGSHPCGSLILKGGDLYGTTNTGGSHNKGTIFKYRDCTNSLTIPDTTTYNGSTWSANHYSTVTIGTVSTNTITATTNQTFKFSNNTVVNGPFSTGTGSNTLDIVPTPCP